MSTDLGIVSLHRCMRFVAALGMATAAMSMSEAAHAAPDIFEVRSPRIFSIQERARRLGHEFELGAAVMPLDNFYIGVVPAASYTYHLSDLWGLEILRLHYSINIDTGLETELLDAYNLTSPTGFGEQARWFATTGVVIKPSFGKFARFNRKVTYGETYIGLGVGPFASYDERLDESFIDASASVALGLRFWLSDFLSSRFEIRYLAVMKQWLEGDPTRTETGREDVLLLGLSMAFNSPPEDAEATAHGQGHRP